ncbi:unnamed protein product [Adineta ricciae]|uniref:Lebercilin domain-containing protein n=1 Tax=Adineta ricciae TaxID=249248 RepID=A0A814BSV0_ADIRI|nr:unnamed protein product [Adineta ricciae]
MPERNGLSSNVDEYFSGTKSNSDDDKNKTNQVDPSTPKGIAALVRPPPRQAPAESKPNVNSKTTSMTTNDKNAPTSQPSKANTVESEYDDDTNRDEKKKQSSLPTSKQRQYDTSRRGSDSEMKGSFSVTNGSTPRREQFLPYLRPKNRQKGAVQRTPSNQAKKTDSEQRLSSAQNEKLNELRSHMSLLQRQLEQERSENKTLRIIQKREEKSLRTFEDREYDAQRVAQEFKYEIDQVKRQIGDEKEEKAKLQKEVDEQDEQYRDQSKKMKFYEKLIAHEDEYEEYEDLRDRLKEMDKQLKKVQDKITKQEKQIQSIEQNHRQEMAQHLSKRRELKHDLDDQSKKCNELFLKLEEKTRQVDTMHIHIQRGGRRPSDSSFENLKKSHSYQELPDTSPQFREKMLEYDRKRRELDKDKPKPPPLPLTPPPKPPRKKYVPSIDLKPKSKTKPKIEVKPKSPSPPPIKREETPPITQPVRVKSPVHRLPTPESYDDDTSEFEEDIVIEPAIYRKPRSPRRSPPPQPRIILPPPKPRSPSPPPQPKPSLARNFDDKWMNIFSNDKKEESKKDDLLSKLTAEEPKDKQPRTSMFTFEPATLSTNTTQKKPPPRVVTSVYDFEQAVLNLHDGKPVTAHPSTSKKATGLGDSPDHMDNKLPNRLLARENSFTKASGKPSTLESRFALPTVDNGLITASSLTTTGKPNSKIPTSVDRLQRPKVVTNAPKPVPNRTVVEEIEEFTL